MTVQKSKEIRPLRSSKPFHGPGKLLLMSEEKEVKDEVRKLFSLADHDGDGDLTAAELADVVTKLSKRPIPESELKGFMDTIDTNKDGKITVDEFVEATAAFVLRSRHKRSAGEGSAAGPSSPKRTRHEILSIFRYDEPPKDWVDLEKALRDDAEASGKTVEDALANVEYLKQFHGMWRQKLHAVCQKLMPGILDVHVRLSGLTDLHELLSLPERFTTVVERRQTKQLVQSLYEQVERLTDEKNEVVVTAPWGTPWTLLRLVRDQLVCSSALEVNKAAIHVLTDMAKGVRLPPSFGGVQHNSPLTIKIRQQMYHLGVLHDMNRCIGTKGNDVETRRLALEFLASFGEDLPVARDFLATAGVWDALRALWRELEPLDGMDGTTRLAAPALYVLAVLCGYPHPDTCSHVTQQYKEHRLAAVKYFYDEALEPAQTWLRKGVSRPPADHPPQLHWDVVANAARIITCLLPAAWEQLHGPCADADLDHAQLERHKEVLGHVIEATIQWHGHKIQLPERKWAHAALQLLRCVVSMMEVMLDDQILDLAARLLPFVLSVFEAPLDNDELHRLRLAALQFIDTLSCRGGAYMLFDAQWVPRLLRVARQADSMRAGSIAIVKRLLDACADSVDRMDQVTPDLVAELLDIMSTKFVKYDEHLREIHETTNHDTFDLLLAHSVVGAFNTLAGLEVRPGAPHHFKVHFGGRFLRNLGEFFETKLKPHAKDIARQLQRADVESELLMFANAITELIDDHLPKVHAGDEQCLAIRLELRVACQKFHEQLTKESAELQADYRTIGGEKKKIKVNFTTSGGGEKKTVEVPRDIAVDELRFEARVAFSQQVALLDPRISEQGVRERLFRQDALENLMVSQNVDFTGVCQVDVDFMSGTPSFVASTDPRRAAQRYAIARRARDQPQVLHSAQLTAPPPPSPALDCAWT